MKPATMTNGELSEFVTKYIDLLNAGKKARLVMDCENGRVYVNLEVQLGYCHPSQPQAGFD